MASVTYDKDANALYVMVREGKRVSKTVPLGEGAYLDVSEDGKAVGLEIIFPRSTPQETIDDILGIEKTTQLFSKIFSKIMQCEPLLQ